MKKKFQIFISSTYTDLIEERQAAVSAILKAGHIPAGMELFTAGDQSQMETIKRWIDESDMFMLILGGRYGSIEPSSSLSYTELEYDYAVKTGKPYFAVVIDPSALDQKVRMHGSSVIETENTKELAAFQQKVLGRISAFFKDANDIKLTVYETISDFIARYDFKGWVSGDEIPDIQSFTDQINKLREENKRLVEDRSALAEGAVFTPSEEREFSHIRQKLDRDISLHHNLYRLKEDGKTNLKVAEEIYKVNLLNAIVACVGKGYHHFHVSNLAYVLSERLNDSYPPKGAPEIKRGNYYRSIKENLALELQTYGLCKLTTVDANRPLDSIGDFTEKMYRLVYWLDYNGYTPEIQFELESVTEVSLPVTPQSLPKPKVESSTLRTVKDIDRQLNFKAQRNRWRTSEEGVMSARQEFDMLCEKLEFSVNKSNNESQAFTINFSRLGQFCGEVSGIGVSLHIIWNYKNHNTLEDSVLSITGNKTRFDVEGVGLFAEEKDRFLHYDFDIELNKDMKIVWQRREDNEDLTTSELARIIIADLLGAIQHRVKHNK